MLNFINYGGKMLQVYLGASFRVLFLLNKRKNVMIEVIYRLNILILYHYVYAIFNN